MDDADLSLNITSSESYFGTKREKIKGSRAERIKKRKQIKLERKKVSVSDGKNGHAGKRKAEQIPISCSNDDGSPPRKFAKKDLNQPAGIHKKSGDVVSSLFRHNPNIPSVKSLSVAGKREEVFASTKFSDLPLFPHLISNLEQKLQLTIMTRVQQMSIPVILTGEDVLVKSQTGSGKTLAYAVPVVHTLAVMPKRIERNHGPYALVIVPTRELAIQSYETFQKLLQSCVWVVAGCLMGGENRQKEKSRIRKGINILVTTPGRLLDHLKQTSCLNVHNVRWLIIDEADRLLELGYEKDIAEIVSTLNTQGVDKRQTILLSATLTSGVERLSGMALKNHRSIDASESISSADVQSPKVAADADTDNVSTVFTVPDKLKQHFIVVPCKLRLVTLAAFILMKCKSQISKSKMVVFLNTQNSVDFHHQLFTEVFNTPKPAADNLTAFGKDLKEEIEEDIVEEVQLFKLHGDMVQKDRTKVFQEFSAASSGVLLCTDVASRGLHLPKVDWIVQYSTPGVTVDYIHRVGRTARAGKHGNAVLFLMPHEASYIQELNKEEISLSELSMQDVLTTLLSAINDLPQKHRDSKRQWPQTYEEASTYLQDRFEEKVIENRGLQELAVKGYQSFVKAYATYPSHLKVIFSLKDLHLGHVAKSFALRRAPSHLVTKRFKVKHKGQMSEGNPKLKFNFNAEKDGFKKKKKRSFSTKISEFSSGMPSKKKQRKLKLHR